MLDRCKFFKKAIALVVVGLLAPVWAMAAAPTFVGSVSDSANDNMASLTMTLPAHATDDFGITCATADHSGQSPLLALTVATGWTQLFNEIESDARARRTACWYKKFLSASETAPVITCSANSDHSASVHIFGGVDTTTPFDAAYTQGFISNTITPTNEDIVTATANATVFLLDFHNYIVEYTAAVAPSGYVLGEVPEPNTHGSHFVSYDLDVGAAATIDPAAWGNTGTHATSDSSLYTLALRPAGAAASPTIQRRRLMTR